MECRFSETSAQIHRLYGNSDNKKLILFILRINGQLELEYKLFKI